MEPLNRSHGFECKYANVNRELFLRNLLESVNHSHQPLPGPNFVGGKILGKLARLEGIEFLLSGELCDTVFGGLKRVPPENHCLDLDFFANYLG